jgi:hypothetical protein
MHECVKGLANETSLVIGYQEKQEKSLVISHLEDFRVSSEERQKFSISNNQ